MWFNILFGSFLIVFSAILLLRTRAAWRSGQTDEVKQGDREFLDRQYRRRRQANWMIALVGLTVIVGAWVPEHEVTVAVAYWLGTGLLVCWMAWLAVADMIATRIYFGRLQRDQKEERTRLEAELEHLRARNSNGKPRHQSLEERK